MKVHRWILCGIGSLWILGALLGGGCSGDDEAETNEGVGNATTNGGGDAGGSTLAGDATDAAPADAEDEADASADADVEGAADAGDDADAEGEIGAVLTAPLLLAPQSGQIFYTALATAGSGLKPNVVVTCRWLPASGAADYKVTMEDSTTPGVKYTYIAEETTISGRYMTSATHKWSVQARDADGRLGPSSKVFTFIVRNWLLVI